MPYKIIFLTVFIPTLFFSCSVQTKKDQEYQFEQKTFKVDTSFVAKATVESICPCQTTLADIMKSSTLQTVDVEIMEQGKNCISSDSRFENDKGYSLTQTKGLIVQKDDGTEYVTKVHLTKDFEGRLPNGKFVSIKNLKLKGVVKMYPNLDYGTRECSEYWNYNNDTIHFYFKVNKTINRYPLDENLYADKPIEGIDIVLWCYKMYGPDYSGEVVYERPLYAPLLETHVNTYVWKQREDVGTKIKEVTTFGKRSNYDIIRLGKWLEYSSDHQLMTEEYYDNKGSLVKKVR
ncbi:hypothetical protein KIH41_06420 [Litoribacter ruber]|uniref:hypothetical protein n=1 Tax=Litoribacter ruber TaxID=702568 RepID=UPI001BDAB4BE|nr:hypothetical protein [Litoribacter ruber]MBT0810913.1 hypothetical protein [Litoribacter ruber]